MKFCLNALAVIMLFQLLFPAADIQSSVNNAGNSNT
ncbi:hypothetical protein IGJ11_002700 [Enterococcus sp. DIV0691]